MIDLAAMKKRFPDYTIRSQPAIGCGCIDGVRKTKTGNEFPCICVCMSEPDPGDIEYRDTLCKDVGAIANKIILRKGELK